MPRYNPADTERGRVLKAVLRDPAASPEAKVQAAALLDRMTVRREAKRKKAAALTEVLTTPAAKLDPETIAELKRRGLDGPTEKPCATCGDPMGWRVFDDRVFCWRHTPARTMPQRDGMRLSHVPCAAPDCPNYASHQKSGKDYCWSHYPNFPQ